MKKLDAKLAQLIEFPRYLAFVWRACGASVAVRAAAWTLLSVRSIVRSGTLRAVDERLSQLRPSVRDGDAITRWARADFGLFRDILLRRCYWPDDAFIPRAGETVVDLGANVGVFSVLAARRMGAGRVIAIEAQAYEHDALVRNIELNDVGSLVTPLLGFAGTGGAFEDSEHRERTIDLDAVLREHGVDEITLLKVDIEGSEFGLFASRPAWLRLVRRIAMEVHPPYGDVEVLAELLRGEGFGVTIRPSAMPAAAVYLYAVRAPMAAERVARDDLLQLVVCPDCRDGELVGLDADLVDGEVRCSLCGAAYPVRGGIPVLLPAGFDASSVHDEIDHVHEHKHRQADYFDRGVAEEFEITRPHGAPEAYRWLLRRKFERGVARLASLDGAIVADACCGSGMDAEMLAREGARVLAIDISEGCARRARERARRYGLDYLVVVGDVEHLPLRDCAADVSYVHDGLHHLANPAAGLRELARVACHAVSINEPADALGTAAMVRLGVSLEREDAGNRVARLRPADVARELAPLGFDVAARRYLMYYRHEPGRLMRLASRPIARIAYRALASLADAALGRWGNKLQVTAVRRRGAAEQKAASSEQRRGAAAQQTAGRQQTASSKQQRADGEEPAADDEAA